MNIPMPNEHEKSHSIEKIIRDGYAPQKNLLNAAHDVIHTIGVKNIFFGTEDCILAAIIFFAAAFICAITTIYEVSDYRTCYPHFTLFTVTPLFYAAANLLSIWKEDTSGVLAIKRTCKYTPEHLMAFRMIFFSIINMLIVIPPVAVVSEIVDNVYFIKLLLVSFSSIFIYSVLMTFLLIKSSKPVFVMIAPVIWIFILGVLWSIMKNRIEEFLINTSIISFAACVLIAIILYTTALNKLIKKGVKEHAYS